MPSSAHEPLAATLRLRAEQRLSERQTAPLSADEAQRTLHELQVHQIELQLQNEALQASEAEAHEALRRLEELHHSMEERIIQRTAQLTATKDALELEVYRRQMVEDELRSERAALERRVQERTQALERATAEARAARSMAEQASLQKDHFLAKVSHELRTPLQSMLGWSQLLQRGDMAPELAVRAAERIIHNVGLQARLIDDLLDISRILSGKLQLSLQEVSALDIVERATGVVRHAAQEKAVTIDLVTRIHPGARIRTDAARLEQVIWNLLGNAIHASGQGGQVRLSVDIDLSVFRLSVQDWGAGIEAAEMDHIFEPFRQGAGAGRRRGGLGLGLSIARHIVTLLSGEIRVRSAGPGHGAEFVVELPIDPEATLNPASSLGLLGPPPCASLKGLKIAYVEDEPDIAESCTLMLRALGADVDTCLTFEQGQRLMRQGGFDILLTDMKLDEGHTGTELLQTLRHTRHGRNMPALVLSAYGSEADRQASVRMGFDQHLVKPVDADAVSTAIMALRQSRC